MRHLHGEVILGIVNGTDCKYCCYHKFSFTEHLYPLQNKASCAHYVYAQSLSRVQLFVTPWTISPPGPSVHGVFQARVLEWVAISASGDLPDSRIRLASLVSPALAGRFLTTTQSGKFCFPIRCALFPYKSMDRYCHDCLQMRKLSFPEL